MGIVSEGREKMKRWTILCLTLILILSGCSLRMTTQEKLDLYGDGNIQIAGDGSVQIEQITSNQVSQIITERAEYSVQELGALFLDMSPEECDRAVEEYYAQYTSEAEREYAEQLEIAIPLEKGEAILNFSNRWMTFYEFPDASCYANTLYSTQRLLQPDVTGIITPMDFRYRSLDMAFSRQELDGCTKEEAKADCDRIAQAVGFILEESECYTMDVESMNRIQQITGFPSLDTETDEAGNIVGELKPWKTEQGCYLFLYKKGIQGKVIESVASENVLFLIYHPEKKLVFAEWIQGVNEQEVLSEKTVTVISGEEAVAQAQLYFSQQNQSDIVINSARLTYASPMLNYNALANQITMDPCWDISYQYVENGINVNDHVLIHAVTGSAIMQY